MTGNVGAAFGSRNTPAVREGFWAVLLLCHPGLFELGTWSG